MINDLPWNLYPETMPPKSGQYNVKWSNGKVNVEAYNNGFITIDEMLRNPPHNILPEVYIVAWRLNIY